MSAIETARHNKTRANGKPVSATLASIIKPEPPTPDNVKIIDPTMLRVEMGKAVPETVTIKLAPLQYIHADIPIRGLSPMLVAGWTRKSLDMMERPMVDAGYKKPKKDMREKRDPDAEFEEFKVRDEQGRECIPALHVKCAMVNAGIRRTSGVFKADLRAAVFVRGNLIPFTYSKCEKRRDAVRNKSGVADLRWRPEYHDWHATIPLRIDTGLITLADAVNLLNIAGSMVGLGEWRIEKGGEHGAFEVAL